MNGSASPVGTSAPDLRSPHAGVLLTSRRCLLASSVADAGEDDCLKPPCIARSSRLGVLTEPRPSSSAYVDRECPKPSSNRPYLAQDCFFSIEFRKRSECEDSFDYVGSSSSWTRSSSKRVLRYR